MGILRRRADGQEQSNLMEPAPVDLAQTAIDALHMAAGVEPEHADSVVEERNVWQPDSWLLQQCWQALAENGDGEEALTVATMLELRNPLAPVQALRHVASQIDKYPQLATLVARELAELHVKLFSLLIVSDEKRQIERLLLAAASAAAIEDDALVFACLERLDQLPRAWDWVFVKSELRAILAEVIVHVGLHPLTVQLLASAVRRFEDAGAELLHQILTGLGPQVMAGRASAMGLRLMRRCVETFQYATLTTLNSRRLAAIAFGRAGKVEEVLAQIMTMANVQEGRRESGLAVSTGDPFFLRQVKRPTANPDVDYQVYTLQEAIRAMPVRTIERSQRIALADQVASLAIQSDGWTAAGAATTLIRLGALKYAVDVVDHIPANDPTRSEGVISLVSGLLDFGERELAEQQVGKALAWLKSFDGRNPERATVWGLAELFLQDRQSALALRLLDYRYEPPDFGDRLRMLFGKIVSDDELRDNRLRMQALLQQSVEWSSELQGLYDQLSQWGPKLLEGEGLISFYVDGLLRPLLEAGRYEQVWPLLPQIRQALSIGSGNKHAVHVARVTDLLAEYAIPKPEQTTPVSAQDGYEVPGDTPEDTSEQSPEQPVGQPAGELIEQQVEHTVEQSIAQAITADSSPVEVSTTDVSPLEESTESPWEAQWYVEEPSSPYTAEVEAGSSVTNGSVTNSSAPDLHGSQGDESMVGDSISNGNQPAPHVLDAYASNEFGDQSDQTLVSSELPASESPVAELPANELPLDVRARLESFLIELWQSDRQKGIWQIIHSLEGSLRLLLVLEGPQSLVAIARAAANEGGLWTD